MPPATSRHDAPPFAWRCVGSPPPPDNRYTPAPGASCSARGVPPGYGAVRRPRPPPSAEQCLAPRQELAEALLHTQLRMIVRTIPGDATIDDHALHHGVVTVDDTHQATEFLEGRFRIGL